MKGNEASSFSSTNQGLFEGLREKAEEVHEGTDYAVILVLPVGIVHRCQFIRGLVDIYNVRTESVNLPMESGRRPWNFDISHQLPLCPLPISPT